MITAAEQKMAFANAEQLHDCNRFMDMAIHYYFNVIESDHMFATQFLIIPPFFDHASF